MNKAEERANKAEDHAQQVEEEHASLVDLFKDSEECLRMVENKVVELEEELKVSRECATTYVTSEEIIKKYLAFANFQDELIECGANGFIEGFNECHHHICKMCLDLNVSELKKVYDDGMKE